MPLESAGVWFESEGRLRPTPPPNPRGRTQTNVPTLANAIPAVADSPMPSSFIARPRPVPLPGRARYTENQPLDYGDLDDTFLPAWGLTQIFPPVRLMPAPVRQPASERFSIQVEIDQSIDFIATYSSPPPRLPLLPLGRQPNQTKAGDPIPFTQRDLDEWYAAVVGQIERPRRLVPVPNRSGSVLTRDSGQEDFYVAWITQTIRPAGLPRREGQMSALLGRALPPLPDEQFFWFGQSAQPHPPLAAPFRALVLPPWMSMISIAVPGPFYVIAGQVSPAGGAVAGEVKAVGED